MTDKQNSRDKIASEDITQASPLDRFWHDLATSAEYPRPMPSGQALAEWLGAGEGPRERIAAMLGRVLYDSMAALDEADPAAVARLSDLIGYLKLPLLTDALAGEIGVPSRSVLLRAAAQKLSVRALLRLLQASLKAAKRPLTPPIKDLAPKLARDAIRPRDDGSVPEEAVRLFRDVVAAALEPLTANRLFTGPYERRSRSRAAPRKREAGRAHAEADRVIFTALEVGASGPVVAQAVADMVEQGRSLDLLSALKEAPEDNPAARMIAAKVATLGELQRQLKEEPVDFAAVDVIVSGLGIGAAKVLLEVLAESRSRNTRRGAYERLARLGPEIAPLVQPRLRDSRWFVVRNMISLMREAGVAPKAAGLARYVKHIDPRVRREALMLLLSFPETREQAVVDALRDDDRNVLRAGLQGARTGLPDSAVPIITRRLSSGEFPPEFRVLALHLLGRSSSVLALDALLQVAQDGRSLTGRPKLAQKTPEMLAAISALARGWPNERRAEALLNVARKSRDEQIREATRVATEPAEQ